MGHLFNAFSNRHEDNPIQFFLELVQGQWSYGNYFMVMNVSPALDDLQCIWNLRYLECPAETVELIGTVEDGNAVRWLNESRCGIDPHILGAHSQGVSAAIKGDLGHVPGLLK
jgi:hypothetical protein